MIAIPPEPGVYAVEFTMTKAQSQRIGRLVEARFPKGGYIYLGSARGPGGLRARLRRHLKSEGITAHWHIDAFKPVAKAVAYCYINETRTSSQAAPGSDQPPLECTWSQGLADLPGASIPVRGFGASDCRCGCRAHLVCFHACENDTHKGIPVLAMHEIQEALVSSAGIPRSRLICTQV